MNWPKWILITVTLYVRKLILKIDPKDVMAFAGIGVMGAGLWMRQPWISLTVVGGIILFIAILWSRK